MKSIKVGCLEELWKRAKNLIGTFGKAKTALFPFWRGIKISEVPDENAGYSIYAIPIGSKSQDMKLLFFIYNKFHKWLLDLKKTLPSAKDYV